LIALAIRIGGRLWRFLRAPRVALAVLSFQALYAQVALTTGLVTFSSPLFLACAVVLFLATFVCTAERTRLNVALSRGAVRAYGVALPRGSGDVRVFLEERGFRGRGRVLFRHRWAIWGGWVLHVGVLALLLGVLVQRSFHEGGAFELSEGETARLSEMQILGREAGVFAAKNPPPIDLTLVAYDPFFHQRGYAPDRASRIRVGGRDRFVDRAKGVDVDGVTIFQAVPTSLAVTMDIAGLGLRSIHLQTGDARRAVAELKDPSGECLRIVARTERPLADPAGTGDIQLSMEGRGGTTKVIPGVSFAFGSSSARVVGFSRWAGFTYSRSPGIPLVFAGFLLVLLGSTLLVFPAGVARIPEDGAVAAWLYAKRGLELIVNEWIASAPAVACNDGREAAAA
jgi:hypothetical protein